MATWWTRTWPDLAHADRTRACLSWQQDGFRVLQGMARAVIYPKQCRKPERQAAGCACSSSI